MFYSLSHISPWIWSPVLRGLICLLFFRAEAELTFLHAFAKVLQRLIFLLLMHFVTFLTSRLQFSPSPSVWIFLCSHLSVPLINYKKNSRAAWWFDGRLHEIVFVSAVFLQVLHKGFVIIPNVKFSLLIMHLGDISSYDETIKIVVDGNGIRTLPWSIPANVEVFSAFTQKSDKHTNGRYILKSAIVTVRILHRCRYGKVERINKQNQIS